MDASLCVEGMVYEEQEGHVNIYSILYYILQGFEVSLPWFLTPQGIENSQALLHKTASAHKPTAAFLSSSWHLKKRGKASKNEGKNYR
jgi:hypothetical protein